MTNSILRARNRPLNLRVAGVVIAVVAILVHVNIAQLEDDREAALHSYGILNANVETVLAERRTEAASNAVFEYGALVSAGFGVLLTLGGPLLVRRIAKEINAGSTGGDRS